MGKKIIDLIEIKEKRHEQQKRIEDSRQDGEWAFVCEVCGETDEMRMLVTIGDDKKASEFIGFRCTCCGARIEFYDEEQGRIGFVLAEDGEQEC